MWRDPHGKFTTFDVGRSGTAADQGTFPEAINPVGVIAGEYVDASDVGHGFLAIPIP